jgi:hypothetical protein
MVLMNTAYGQGRKPPSADGLHGEGPAVGLGDLPDHPPRGGLGRQAAEHHRDPVGGQPFHDRLAYPA